LPPFGYTYLCCAFKTVHGVPAGADHHAHLPTDGTKRHSYLPRYAGLAVAYVNSWRSKRIL